MWDLGLGGLGATACAGLLDNPSIVITNAHAPQNFGDLVAVYGLPDTADAPYFTYVGSPVSKLTFPYGYHVQPNVLV